MSRKIIKNARPRIGDIGLGDERLTIHLARQSLQKPFFHSPQADNAYEKKGERAIFQRGKERNRSRKIGKIGWKIGKDW